MATPTFEQIKAQASLTPQQNLAIEQAKVIPLNNSPINTTLNATKLGNVNPIVVPPVGNGTIPIPPSVSNPIGTTVDATGNAVVAPPVVTPEKTNYQKILDKVSGLGDTLATKADVTKDLQEENQLAQKTEASTVAYNTYNKKKLEYQQQIDRLYNTPGKTTGQIQQEVQQISRQSNADLANLAVEAQASQGLLTAAEKTIKDKLDAQFQPIQDQIDYYTKFAQLNQNDLSESDKLKLTEIADAKKADLTSLRETSDLLHTAFLENGAPQTVYSALDRINDDFVAGKIDATEAKSKMYQASGKYGVDALRQAQIGSANRSNQISESNNVGASGISYTPKQITAINKINENVSKNATYAKTSSMRNYGDNVLASLSQANGVADIAAINQFQKVIDEGAVTRDQDVKLIQGAQSLADSLKLKVKKLEKGEQLSSTQRTQMRTLVEDLYGAQVKALLKDPYIASKNNEATLNGIDPIDTILGELSTFQKSQPEQAPLTNGSTGQTSTGIKFTIVGGAPAQSQTATESPIQGNRFMNYITGFNSFLK